MQGSGVTALPRNIREQKVKDLAGLSIMTCKRIPEVYL
jgi:hypothetical protein